MEVVEEEMPQSISDTKKEKIQATAYNCTACSFVIHTICQILSGSSNFRF
jgi:hypothetical protein